MRFIQFAATLIVVYGCDRSPAASSRSGPSSPHEERVLSIVATQFGLRASDIDVKQPFKAQHIDADELDVVELVMEMEDQFGVSIADAAIDSEIGSEKPDAGKLSVAILAKVAANASPATRPATVPLR